MKKLSLEQKILLCLALTDEFCDSGLQENYEPTRHGLLIESVIDAILDHHGTVKD